MDFSVVHVATAKAAHERAGQRTCDLDIEVWVQRTGPGYELRVMATERGGSAPQSAALFTGGPQTLSPEALLNRTEFEESVAGPLLADCWSAVNTAVAKASDGGPADLPLASPQEA